jgi:hypothetical protein
LEGWEKGAKTIGRLTGKMLSDVVNRVAIIADEKRRGEEERIADVAKKPRSASSPRPPVTMPGLTHR